MHTLHFAKTGMFLRRLTLILKFQVYKNLRIQINIMERKKIMFKTETNFFFSCVYATMKPKVTLRPLTAIKGYSGLLPEANFKGSHAYCISNTPSPFFDVMFKKVY